MMTLNHGFSGYVCSRVVWPVVKPLSPLSGRAIGWGFFLGAMLPDLDILSRAFGRQVYFSAAWYAHRHASHSILGTLALALAATGIVLLAARVAGRPRLGGAALVWLAGSFWGGGLLHIMGDLVTPGWGMPVFWPASQTFGGWRHIGWFSPYLLWLFLSAMVLGGGLGWLARVLERRAASLTVWAAGAAWAVYALAVYRWLDFLAGSRYESWDQWLAYQRTLLPDFMVMPVTGGVRFLWRFLTS